MSGVQGCLEHRSPRVCVELPKKTQEGRLSMSTEGLDPALVALGWGIYPTEDGKVKTRTHCC